MKFTKKPITIEAIQWVGENLTDITKFCPSVDSSNLKEGELTISTLEGILIVSINDWVIKGVKGEFYPCKPDIFELTYDKEKNIGI